MITVEGQKMDEAKDIFNRVYQNPNAFWTRKQPPQELITLVGEKKIKPPGKALDVGCGEGFYSIYLASKGFDVLGIDLSDRAIRYAKTNAEKQEVNVRFMAMDVADLSRLGEKFDFVLEWALLHHIMPKQRKKYVQDIANLLNHNGKYLSVSFNEKSPEFGKAGQKHRTSPTGAKLYYASQTELKELFKANFKIIESKIVTVTGSVPSDTHISNYFLLDKQKETK